MSQPPQPLVLADAVFDVTEVQRGLFPMAGSAVRLRRQASYAVAAEMLLTGEDIRPGEPTNWD